MPKPYAAYEPITNRPTKPGTQDMHIIAKRVVPRYNPASSKAGDDGWVYRKWALHATKGWRKV